MIQNLKTDKLFVFIYLLKNKIEASNDCPEADYCASRKLTLVQTVCLLLILCFTGW